MLKRVGQQSTYQAHMVIIEAAAYMVLPVLAGVLEQCVHTFTTFSILMILMGGNIILVLEMYEPLKNLTERIATSFARDTGVLTVSQPMVLDSLVLRRCLVLIASFLVVGGCVTLVVSFLEM